MGLAGQSGRWVQTLCPMPLRAGVVTPGSAGSDPDWLGGSRRTLAPLLPRKWNYQVEGEILLLSIYLSLYLFIYVSICLSVCLSISPYAQDVHHGGYTGGGCGLRWAGHMTHSDLQPSHWSLAAL